jgi:hypothetical protein
LVQESISDAHLQALMRRAVMMIMIIIIMIMIMMMGCPWPLSNWHHCHSWILMTHQRAASWVPV